MSYNTRFAAPGLNRRQDTIRARHVLPPLDYDYADLQRCIDARTMMLHHDRHHATYVEKLNRVLDDLGEPRHCSALWLLLHLDRVPERLRAVVHRNAGGHVNHSLYWRAMNPGGGGRPQGDLAAAIDRDFGSLETFKEAFEKAGSELFGSGWVWLVSTHGTLSVVTTSGHDHPLMQGQFPVVLNDVWEHAYYLRYENRRDRYLRAWWSVIDWTEASRRFELSSRPPEIIMEAESALLDGQPLATR